MDRNQFDDVTRSLAACGSRRAMLGTLFGAALLSRAGEAAANHRQRSKRKRRSRADSPSDAPITRATCYTRTDCQPGRGEVTTACDFAGSTLLRGRDLRGAVLSHSNLAGVDLSGADLRGAVLDDTCLAGAILIGAVIDRTTVLGRTIFCSTIMPDGSIFDRDCDRGSVCCPTNPGGGSGGGGGAGEGACIELGVGCNPTIPQLSRCCTGYTCSRVMPDGRLGAYACRRPDGSIG